MIYRGGEGMLAYYLHRISGIGVFVFLMAHIVDTFLVGFGPDVYNTVTAIYHHPVARVLEVVLVAGLLYHALNGTRVILIDFWGEGTRYQRVLFWTEAVVLCVLFLPAAYLMLRPMFVG